jgi:hypothetical protein
LAGKNWWRGKCPFLPKRGRKNVIAFCSFVVLYGMQFFQIWWTNKANKCSMWSKENFFQFLNNIWFQFTIVNIFIVKTSICLEVAEFSWNWPNFEDEFAEKLWKNLATVDVTCFENKRW